MSKKKLLSEAQVRRFMGLAGINPLNEMYSISEEGEARPMEEDEMDEARSMKRKKHEDMHGDKDKEKSLMEEEDMEDEDMDDMEDEDEAGAADLDIDEKKVMKFIEASKEISDMADMLSGATGGDMDDVLGNDDMPKDEEPPPPPGDDMDDMGDMGDDDALEEELMEVDMELTEEEIVNEVARRVAKRIVEAKRAPKKMNEALGRKTPSRKRRRK